MAEANFFDQTKRGRGRVKHEILKYYLGGYFGAVGQCQYYKRVIFIDGFAGPGQYTCDDGTIEEGSPLIAFKTVAEHVFYKRFHPILLIFVEKKENNKVKLENNLEQLRINYPNSDKIEVKVIFNDFESYMDEFLEIEDYINDPMLIFADPFGVKGIPMRIMKKLVERPRTELFINFMSSYVIRWIDDRKKATLFNQLVGEPNSEWHKKVFTNKETKFKDFIKFYLENLFSTPSSFNHFNHIFAMKDKLNRNIYQLVFITNYLKAVENMKRAMHNCSQESDSFIYSEWLEAKIEQGVKHFTMTDAEIQADVVNRIMERYQGQKVSGQKIVAFVWCETPYIFNLRNELKNQFKDFVVNNSADFDRMYFQIP